MTITDEMINKFKESDKFARASMFTPINQLPKDLQTSLKNFRLMCAQDFYDVFLTWDFCERGILSPVVMRAAAPILSKIEREIYLRKSTDS